MDNDFVYGMKVTLDNEFGIVIKNESDKPNFCGVIRWDSSKENDFEDWRGLFGTFIQQGGQVLNKNYIFQFINDDGSLKNRSLPFDSIDNIDFK